MPWFRRSLLVVPLAAMLIASGCGGSGGGSSKSSAETWADGVCGSLNTWKSSVTDAGASITGGSMSQDQVTSAVNQVKDATSKLSSDLKGLGRPDTESGQQAQQELQQLGDGIEQHANKARDLVDGASGSGAAGIVDTARSLLVEIGAAADQLKSALTSLEQAGQDIRDGIQSSDSCQKLRDRDFASG